MRRVLAILVMALASISAMAASVNVDGIYYELNNSNKRATVTPKGESGQYTYGVYSGDVVVPSEVTYNDKTYTVTYIGGGAFSECNELASVTLPSTITTIQANAFRGCSSLTSITIPKSVVSIAEVAFAECNSLTAFTVEQGNSSFCSVDGVLFDIQKKKLISYPAAKEDASYTIPDGVELVSQFAFSMCNKLTNVIVSSGVRTIDWNAFNGSTSLQSVNIQSGVITMGSNVFKNCTNLTSVTIPPSVTDIGYGVFDGTALYSDENNWDNGVLYIDNCVIEAKSDVLSGTYTIKEGTRVITDNAFSDCSKLTDISIPSTVKSMGAGVFGNCSSLKSISIPEGVTALGSYIFSECGSLKNVTLPENLESISSYAFYGCNSIEHINMPLSVTSIGTSAFYNCSGLESIVIPYGVTTINSHTFYGCSNLKQVEIPSSVSSIAGSVFSGCSSLESLTIPSSVSSIGSYAFYGCSGLKSLSIMRGIPPTVSDSYVFNGVDMTIPVYIPIGTEDIYKNRSYWNMFSNYKGGYVINAIAEHGNVSGIGVYLSGAEATLTVVTKEGYQFVGWSDGNTDNPRKVTVVKDDIYEAKFVQLFTLTVEAENGSVVGGGVYAAGTEVEIGVVPDKGYVFSRWNDDNTDNPRVVEVTADMTYTAILEQEQSTQVVDTPTDEVSVRVVGGVIVVEGTTDYEVYSVDGKYLGRTTPLARGIYIVVANGKSYKVVIK